MQQQTVYMAVSLLAAALVFASFLIYNLYDSKINTGTWLILAVGDSVDFWSYFEMTGADWLKNAVPVAFAIGSVITFLVALIRRRFAWPDRWDCLIIALDVVITAWWLSSSDDAAANLLYQGTTLLAFVPMYIGLALGKEKETLLPWVLWTAAYALFLLTAVTHLARWEEMAYPSVGILTHMVVIFFVLVKRRARHA